MPFHAVPPAGGLCALTGSGGRLGEELEMTIWVDADGLPARIRRIIERASRRTLISSVFVADRPLPVKQSDTVSSVVVESGEDRADSYIDQHCRAGDLAVTRDVYLSERLVRRGAVVLDDRGGVYTEENIRERVSLRERMRELREMGVKPERGGGLTEQEIRAFARSLDRLLTLAEKG
jgi:hypothetical protein